MLYWTNFIVACLTAIVCFCIALTVGTWCRYTDRKATPFAFWHFFDVAGIKSSLCFLAISNIAAIWLDGNNPPIWTLPARIILLMFLFHHFYLFRNVKIADFSSPVKPDSRR